MNHRSSVVITDQVTPKPAFLFKAGSRDRRNLLTAYLGVRHRGGMNLVQAETWNYGNLSLSCKGKRDKQRPCELKSIDGQHRGRATRSSEEVLVMSMERRGCVIQRFNTVNSNEDEL